MERKPYPKPLAATVLAIGLASAVPAETLPIPQSTMACEYGQLSTSTLGRQGTSTLGRKPIIRLR